MGRGNVILGALEAEIMEIVWSAGQATVHDALGKLKKARAYTTVQMTLDRLFRKGLLSREKQSHSFVYTARYDRAGYHRIVMESLLPEPGEAILSAFVDIAASADPENLARLEKMIDARKRADKKGKGPR